MLCAPLAVSQGVWGQGAGRGLGEGGGGHKHGSAEMGWLRLQKGVGDDRGGSGEGVGGVGEG